MPYDQLTHKNDLLVKSAITLCASLVSNIEEVDLWLRFISSCIAVGVGILTLIKLVRDLRTNQSEKPKNND